MDPTLTARAAEVLDACRRRRLMLATAESCTGGLIAAALTAVPGSSDVLDRGFVTYSNEAKSEMLGVPADLIASVGAVSEAVAARMAEGAVRHSAAAVAVAVTGIAGPGGSTPGKPVGLVWFGLHRRGEAFGGTETWAEHRIFPGDRDAVRREAALHALGMVLRALD